MYNTAVLLINKLWHTTFWPIALKLFTSPA